MTHMQFFLQRVLEHKMLSGDELDIFEQVAKGHPESYCCARKIGAYIQGVQKEEISREEQ